MKDIKVRDLDDEVIVKIDRLAKSRGLSRNEFLKTRLARIAASPDVERAEERYSALVQYMGEIVEQNTRALNTVIKLATED